MNISAASDTSSEKKRVGFWRNLPLARKLLVTFGTLFVFTFILAVVILNGLSRTQSAYEDALAKGVEIRRLSDDLENNLLQARQSEKNFLLHWREEGFDTAYANYVIPHTKNVADMRTDLTQLASFGPLVATLSAGETTQAAYEADIASLAKNVDDYENSFTALANAYQRKGFDDGNIDYESQFRTAARIFEDETILLQEGLEKLKSTASVIRRNEKDYLLSQQQQYIDNIHLFIPQMKIQIQAADQLTPAVKRELLTQADIYLTAFDGLVVLDQRIAIFNKDLVNSSTKVEELTAKIKALGEQIATKNIGTARSNSAQTFTISIITVFTVLALSILLAVTLSQQLTRPIVALTNTAREISAGKFDIQATVNSTDEIGTLAQAFNIMTSQLRGALQNLDRRANELEQRTGEIELASQQSEKRAQELQTISEIAGFISAERDLTKLLPLVTQSVSERFGFYHVGIFLLDDTEKFAFLRASSSPGGQEMIRLQYNLGVDQTSLVGTAMFTRNPRIVLDIGNDPLYSKNPYLPETRSEMTLPLIARGTTIGAFDVQSALPSAFSEIDVSVLSLLADQIAIAIDNVRLLDDTQNALAEAQTLFSEYTAEAWQRKTTSEVIGYRQTLTGGKVITGNEIGEAGIHLDDEKGTLAIPIQLRDQVIGTLNISPNGKGVHWDADEIDIVQAVAERLALALDNARLFEETSSRASRERLVSDITTKIRGTNDPQEMIKTAVEELKRALGATRVEVVSKSNGFPPDK